MDSGGWFGDSNIITNQTSTLFSIRWVSLMGMKFIDSYCVSIVDFYSILCVNEFVQSERKRIWKTGVVWCNMPNTIEARVRPVDSTGGTLRS
jgi:hypothetical protein